MKRLSNPKSKVDTFAQKYRAALSQHLKTPSTIKSVSATRLGEDAVTLGIKTLALATIHEQAVVSQLIAAGPSTPQDTLLKQTRLFFAEALAPIEATQHTALRCNEKTIQLNEKLDQQTQALVTSNEKLKKEIAKRKTIEKSLRESESHTKQLLKESRHLQNELRDLSHRILSTQEDERKRISRELHDLVSQTMAGITLHLAALKTDAAHNVKGMTKNIERTQKLVEQSVDTVHRFARELRPALLDDLGLLPALQSFTKSFSKETGLHVNLRAFPEVEQISAAKHIVLYRVAQEALTNVARHAHASQVTVDIKHEQHSVSMKIKDDGQSFDIKKLMYNRKNKRLGLLGMRERVEMVGGTFSIQSAPGIGTTVTAQIPFQDNAKEHPQP